MKKNSKFKQNQQEELGLLLNDDKEINALSDKTHKDSKGEENKDIRFNPNLNRKEIDVVTRENQLR